MSELDKDFAKHNNFIRLQEANTKIERQAKIITDLEVSRKALRKENAALREVLRNIASLDYLEFMERPEYWANKIVAEACAALGKEE